MRLLNSFYIRDFYLTAKRPLSILPFRKEGSLQKIALTEEQSIGASVKWTYPCDHIPVFGGVNALRVTTLNMLNHAFVKHLNTVPGWSHCYLVERHLAASTEFPGFSQREEEICKLVIRLLKEDPSTDAICMQECSDRMYELFKRILEPLQIAVILGDGKRENHVVTLVNLDQYLIHEVKITPIFRRYIPAKKEWFWDQWRPAVDLVLEEKPKAHCIASRVRIVNLHISSAGQTPEYKVDRLHEVSAHMASAEFKMGATIVCGDFNACKSLAEPVFSADSFTSLCSHYTQIENIVSNDTNQPEEGPHLVSIDDLLVKIPHESECLHEMFPIHPSKTSDTKAAYILRDVFDPLI